MIALLSKGCPLFSRELLAPWRLASLVFGLGLSDRGIGLPAVDGQECSLVLRHGDPRIRSRSLDLPSVLVFALEVDALRAVCVLGVG